MVKVSQRVVVHRDPFGRNRVFGRGNIVFLRVLVPLLKCAKCVAFIERVGKPQTEAGDRKSKRPHFRVLSMGAFWPAGPLFADVIVHAGVCVMEGMLAIVYHGESIIVFSVSGGVQV